jgi:hypothetical protein
MVFNEEMESARRRMAPQDCKIQGKSNQEMFCGGTKMGIEI